MLRGLVAIIVVAAIVAIVVIGAAVSWAITVGFVIVAVIAMFIGACIKIADNAASSVLAGKQQKKLEAHLTKATAVVPIISERETQLKDYIRNNHSIITTCVDECISIEVFAKYINNINNNENDFYVWFADKLKQILSPENTSTQFFFNKQPSISNEDLFDSFIKTTSFNINIIALHGLIMFARNKAQQYLEQLEEDDASNTKIFAKFFGLNCVVIEMFKVLLNKIPDNINYAKCLIDAINNIKDNINNGWTAKDFRAKDDIIKASFQHVYFEGLPNVYAETAKSFESYLYLESTQTKVNGLNTDDSDEIAEYLATEFWAENDDLFQRQMTTINLVLTMICEHCAISIAFKQ